jgi:uncharacterized protein
MAAQAHAFTGMRGIAAVPSYVVMQPTTLCNLDCVYCYLPFRAADRRMPVSVAEAVAVSVNPWAAAGRFSVVWHGGEPLAAGRSPRSPRPAASERRRAARAAPGSSRWSAGPRSAWR